MGCVEAYVGLMYDGLRVLFLHRTIIYLLSDVCAIVHIMFMLTESQTNFI